MKTTQLIESLESRIAPASVVVNAVAKTATWMDWDGDTLTLKYTSATAPDFLTTDSGAGLLVDKMTFTAAHNNDALTLTVKAGPSGDGHVDLGRIDATGVPLKSWSSPAATIAEFDCGNGTTGVGTFVSATLGAIPYTKFNNTGGDSFSKLNGAGTSFLVKGDIASTEVTVGANMHPVKTITVLGDLDGATGKVEHTGTLSVYGTSDAVVTVGGSLIGGSKMNTGNLGVNSPVGKIVVKGNVVGSTGNISGGIFLTHAKSISILGSIIGGSGDGSGELIANAGAGSVNIAGSVVGGSGLGSGFIDGGNLTSLTIGGSVLGGTEARSGVIELDSARSLTVKGSVIGGQGTKATMNGAIGGIYAKSGVKTLTVGGSLIGGSYDSGVAEGYNGFLATDDYGFESITIKGSIVGHDGEEALIVAAGNNSGATGYAAIGKLTVGGGVKFAYIAAGHKMDTSSFGARIGAAENPDGRIGTITVGGDWFHSSLSAGIDDLTSNGLQNGVDTRAMGNANLHATIGAVTIKGHILDNPNAASFSGFMAEKIASITASGVKVFKTGDTAKSLDSFGFQDVSEI